MCADNVETSTFVYLAVATDAEPKRAASFEWKHVNIAQLKINPNCIVMIN